MNSEPRSTNLRFGLIRLVVTLSVWLMPVLAFAQVEPATEAVAAPARRAAQPAPSLWDLTVQGGIFMIPLAITSVVVIVYAIERAVGLRRKKIVPPELVLAIRDLSLDENGFDPRAGYELCQKYPSALANIIRVALLKAGRPYSELEKAVEDSVARESGQMAHNIRPINVIVSVAPLIGLLGTVQGMIMAFMVTSTTTATGSEKAQELAQGIYTALVTTFAGLCVAIPAVLIAHSLEGRIERLLGEIEDVFSLLLPHFERFEGKVRVRRAVDESGSSGILVRNLAAKSPTTSPAGAAVPTAARDVLVEPKPGKTKGLWGVMKAGSGSSPADDQNESIADS